MCGIFRVKVSSITSVDAILNFSYQRNRLILSRDVIGRLSVKPLCYCLKDSKGDWCVSIPV